MADLLLPTGGEGKDLCDLMRERLGVPETARWFEVRFALGEPVTVRCEYHATQQPIPADEPDDEPAPSNHRGLDG